LKEKPDLEVIRLDLHSFGSEDRLYRALVRASSIPPLGQWGHELHVYLDSFDECLLRIDTVAALLADELPRYPLRRLKLRIACRTATWHPILERALRIRYGEDHFAATELVPLRRADVGRIPIQILPCENRDTLQTPYYLCEVLDWSGQYISLDFSLSLASRFDTSTKKSFF